MTTRKDFIRHSIALSAGAIFAGPSSVFAREEAKYRFFDLHCHPGNFYRRGGFAYPGDAAVIARVKEMADQNMLGACFSLVSDFPLLKLTDKGVETSRAYKKGEGWEEYKRQLTQFKELCGLAPMHIALSSKDITTKPGSVAALISCEGGDQLESVDQLDEMHADGVRVVQLVHYAPNAVGDLQTHEAEHNGLSALGKDVVKRMNKLGMLVDVAHASYDTVKTVSDVATAPFILSHSLLNIGNDRPIAARTISPEHAKLVARSGGIIGAWPSAYSKDFGEYVDNIMRLIDVAGIDHVGLGTDMDSNFKPVMDKYAQLPDLAAALAKKGLGAKELEKLAGGNAERVIKKVLK